MGTDAVEYTLQATLNRMVSPQRIDQLDGFAVRQLNRFTPPVAGETHLAPVPTRSRSLTPDASLARSPSPSRSRWQTVLVEAGGIGAAVSVDSMNSLKFCLFLLGTATNSLQSQIHALRDFILCLTAHQRSSPKRLPPPDDAAQQEEALHRIKTEILSTVKKAVDIISTYAGAALPEQAQNVVKHAILSLPANWARTVQAKNQQQLVVAHPEHRLTLMQEASERVLTFAVEGLDVLNGVARIFGDTVERAQAWLDRLQAMGLASAQRGEEQTQAIEFGGSTRRADEMAP
jgi:hypothetical protein